MPFSSSYHVTVSGIEKPLVFEQLPDWKIKQKRPTRTRLIREDKLLLHYAFASGRPFVRWPMTGNRIHVYNTTYSEVQERTSEQPKPTPRSL